MTSKGYTTRTEIENYLLITIDPSFYAQVDNWIVQIEKYIETFTDRIFIADSATSERIYDGDGTNELIIDDAVSVTKVKIDDVELTAGIDYDYIVEPANKLPKNTIRLLGTIFPNYVQNVKVTAKWGYSTAVPEDIKLAATVLTAGIIYNELEDEASSETIGSYSVSNKMSEGFDDLKIAKDTLEMYRKITF